MNTIVVREYARLTTDSISPTLDRATISASAFEWLCSLSAGYSKSGATLVQLENRRWLKLDNYVGIIQTPCGTLIEILPKHTEEENEASTNSSRALLIKMLAVALDLPLRSADKTSIQTFRHSLLEWVMKQFLLSLDHLLKRGLRFDYQRVEEEQLFLRGQLDVNKQIRQPPGRAHIFNIRHDLYLPDRPENRLLMSALIRVCKVTQQADNWRLSHELASRLAEIPQSEDVEGDFRQWRADRLMAHYQPIKTWCELVLSQYMPIALRGQSQGISMLFPMEKLFERYVETILRKQIAKPYTLKAQAVSKSLCSHMNKKLFTLRPDFLVQQGKDICLVLDAKWKRIVSTATATATATADKYNLAQSDFYQMFAYGHKYLDNKGDMLLVYPKTEAFPALLPPFEFSPDLTLWVVPFDLENDIMHWPSICGQLFVVPLQKVC